jgi:hypothetical protein
MFRFKCTCCGGWHEGIPSYNAESPRYYSSLPNAERAARCVVDSDTCVVDQKFFFVRGCLEIPVQGAFNPFVWGVWVSLSKNRSINSWHASTQQNARTSARSLAGSPPNCRFIRARRTSSKTRVPLRDDGMRPYIELEPTEHPLALEQRCGITAERLAEICSRLEHGLS